MTPDMIQRFPPIPVMLKNGNTGVIRPLDPGDGESLADFYEAIPREDIRFYCPHPLTRERALKNAEAAFSPYEMVLVLITGGNQIAGYAWIRWWKAGATDSVFGICIRRGFQESGAGKALMTRLLEIAREVKPPTVHLTVQKANSRAFALYSQMGFTVVREQMRESGGDFPPEPEYFMELRG